MKFLHGQLTLKKSHLILHFLYCSIFLIFCLILVATDHWTDKRNFTEYLTNIATGISVVLGLVAIFYSFFSNAGLAQSLGNISRVSDEITATRTAMQDVISGANEIAQRGEQNTEQLKTVSQQVAHEIANLEETLQKLSDENSELRAILAPIPERIEQLSSKISASVQPPPAPAAPAEIIQRSPEEATRHADRFLRRSSLTGLAAVTALVPAKEHAADYDCVAIAKLAEGGADYMHGFIVALHCAQLIDTEAVKEKSRTVKVKNLDPMFGYMQLSKVEAEITRRKLPNEADWLRRVRAIAASFEG